MLYRWIKLLGRTTYVGPLMRPRKYNHPTVCQHSEPFGYITQLLDVLLELYFIGRRLLIEIHLLWSRNTMEAISYNDILATPTNHRCPFICQSNHGKKGNKALKSMILTDVTVGLKLL